MFKSWKASNRCIEVALFANEHKDKAMTMKYIRGYLYNFQIDVKLDKEKEMLVTFLCTRKHDAVSAELINDVWMFKRPEFDFTTDDFVRSVCYFWFFHFSLVENSRQGLSFEDDKLWELGRPLICQLGNFIVANMTIFHMSY